MMGGGVIWLKPRSANHNNIKNKQKINIYEKTQAASRSLIYFPPFTSIPGIL